MNESEAALKNHLQREMEGGYLSSLTGLRVTEWLGTELAEVESRQVDLLGRTRDGVLVHLELQATNDPTIALRMAEYALAICRRYGSIPMQLVLYFGEKPLRMESTLRGTGWEYRCRILDIRDVPTDRLSGSAVPEDQVLAILSRFAMQAETIDRILARIAEAPDGHRSAVQPEPTMVTGLRKLRAIIGGELNPTPILPDLHASQ